MKYLVIIRYKPRGRSHEILTADELEARGLWVGITRAGWRTTYVRPVKGGWSW